MTSVILYILISLSITLISYIIHRYKFPKVYYLFPITLYTLAIGTRFETGMDWKEYRDIYIQFNDNFNFYGIEYIYYGINYILSSAGVHYIFLFITTAFFQIFFIFKGLFLNKIDKPLPYIIFFYFFAGIFLSSLNIMRQALSFAIILCAIPNISTRRIWKYSFYTVIATLIHSSSVIFLPLYFLNRFKIIAHRNLILIIFLSSLIFGNYLFKYIADQFFEFINFYQFARYSENFEDNSFKYGIGLWIMKIVDVGLIVFGSRLNKYHNNNITIMYYIFVIGTIINNLSLGNQLIIRLSFCLISFRFILLALLLNLQIINKNFKASISSFQIYVYSTTIYFCMSFVSSIIKNQNGVLPYTSFFEQWF